MCVGRRFAELEIEVAVMRMIREFQIEWIQPDVKFQVSFVNVPAGDVKFKLTDL